MLIEVRKNTIITNSKVDLVTIKFSSFVFEINATLVESIFFL